MLHFIKNIFFVVCFICLLSCVYDYFSVNQKPKHDKYNENNKYITYKFHLHDYFDIHYDKSLIHDTKNYSQTKMFYLVYNFDTLNTDTINTNIISNFENFESFVSYVIHHFSPKTAQVLVRISSPGGAEYKFLKLYSAVKRLKKYNFKTIAFIDDICASGGYMVACAFDKIIATETSQIGSIGVTTTHYNYKGLLDMFGIVEKTFGTGKYKGLNNFNGDNNLDKQYDITEELLNYSLQMFLHIVSTRPNVNLTLVKNAKVWYGRDAYKLNLIDRIGHMDDYLYDLSLEKTSRILYVVSYKKKEDDLYSLYSLFKLFGLLAHN
jgi:signal peptide peptidase SppA